MAEITIEGPLSHQKAIDRSGARFKVARCGRRWGKTTWAYKAAITGHGPNWPKAPVFKGVAHGMHVCWIAPDYSQASGLWETDIRPRFKDVKGIRLDNADFQVWFPNGGALLIHTFENIRAVRGSGKKLAGVVLEEAAHYDVESAWHKEVLPILTDNDGWAVFISSTNGGPDGHLDDAGNKISPSYFNRLCLEIQGGLKTADWAEFHGTAAENPRIGPTRYAALCAEYDPETIAFKQEVLAEIVTGGATQFFKEWRKDLHIVDWESIPDNWSWGAGLDFGYRSPGWCGLFAVSPEGDVVCWDELYFKELHAFEAGRQCGKLMEKNTPMIIACDSAMNQNIGLGPTQFEEFQKGLNSVFNGQGPVLVPCVKGPKSRPPGWNLMHRYLRWTAAEDGSVPPWMQPRLRFHKRCVHAIRTIPALPGSKSDPEDVDTKAEDHPGDGVRYFLMSRPVPGEKYPERSEADRHPGVDMWGKRGEIVDSNLSR